MSVRAERANASPVFFCFQEFSYLAARLVPRGASPPEGVCQGKVSERSKEHAWKVCIPQKGIAGSNPAFSARYPSDPLKAPPNFGGAFRLYASGERSESSQAVYPAARILRSPRRAAEGSGRARFGPADSGSYVGRRREPASNRSVHSFDIAFQAFLRTGAGRVRPEPFMPDNRSESSFSRYVQKKEFSPAARFTRFRLNI